MNELKKFGLDIDEIIARFMKTFFEFYNSEKRENVSWSNLQDYDLYKAGFFKNRKEEKEFVDGFFESTFFREMPLVEGAKKGLRILERNFEINFITSRPSYIRDKTLVFLNKHFPDLKFNLFFSGEVYSRYKKSKEHKTKGEIAEEAGISFMVEDNPIYAVDCTKRGIKVFMINYPWNRHAEEHKNLIKVSGWKEILEKLNYMKGVKLK